MSSSSAAAAADDEDEDEDDVDITDDEEASPSSSSSSSGSVSSRLTSDGGEKVAAAAVAVAEGAGDDRKAKQNDGSEEAPAIAAAGARIEYRFKIDDGAFQWYAGTAVQRSKANGGGTGGEWATVDFDDGAVTGKRLIVRVDPSQEGKTWRLTSDGGEALNHQHLSAVTQLRVRADIIGHARINM